MHLPDQLALIPTTVSELGIEIGKATATDLLAVMPEILRRARLGEYLSAEGAEQETGLTRRQLRHLRDTRKLGYYKHGRVILYRTEELLAFIEAGSVPARPDRAEIL